MTKKEMLTHIDHTLLSPTSQWVQVQQLCEEALRYDTASVCIPPCYVKRAHETFPALNVCTVIGFPLGYSTAGSKVAEAKQAVAEGAGEVDMVINLCDVKNGDYAKVQAEISALRQAVPNSVLKVIVETCYLTEAEKIEMCKAVTAARADYIKTSTGFGTGGATLEDIALFKQHIGPNVKIKASGGIRTLDALEAFLAAGCDRIGTSSAVSLLADA